MSFELVNASVTFQSYINKALHSYLDIIALVYLDDILIYSKRRVEHVKHVRRVLLRLRQYELYAKLVKCEFFVIEIEYLRFRVSVEDVAMKSSRVEII